MDCKAIIFDLDGVLVFTDGLHYRAWQQLATGRGIYFDEKINNRLRGVSRMESLEIILERWEGAPFSQEEKEAMAQEKNATYRLLLEGMSPADVTEEVRQTLDILRGRGLLLAIGSSSKNAKYILERTRLTEYFDGVSDGTNITRSKPHPEVFLKAALAIGVPPAHCAVVEDAEAGIDGAKAAGMLAIGIGEAADYSRSDLRIGSFGELLTL